MGARWAALFRALCGPRSCRGRVTASARTGRAAKLGGRRETTRPALNRRSPSNPVGLVVSARARGRSRSTPSWRSLQTRISKDTPAELPDDPAWSWVESETPPPCARRAGSALEPTVPWECSGARPPGT